MPDIIISPQRGTSNNPTIQFSGSSAANIRLEVASDGSVSFISGSSSTIFTINSAGLNGAAANTLSGTTLASNVLASSLTSLGTIASLTATQSTFGGNSFTGATAIFNAANSLGNGPILIFQRNGSTIGYIGSVAYLQGGVGNDMLVDAMAGGHVYQAIAGANITDVTTAGLAVTGNLTGTGIYTNTTANAANVYTDSSGLLYRSTSSGKYKRDITNYTHGLTDVLKLRPVFYKGISDHDGETQYAGLIAEEVADAGLDEFVVKAADGTPDALAYSNMVALTIKAIQEQDAELKSLRARMLEMEAKLAKLL